MTQQQNALTINGVNSHSIHWWFRQQHCKLFATVTHMVSHCHTCLWATCSQNRSEFSCGRTRRESSLISWIERAWACTPYTCTQLNGEWSANIFIGGWESTFVIWLHRFFPLSGSSSGCGYKRFFIVFIPMWMLSFLRLSPLFSFFLVVASVLILPLDFLFFSWISFAMLKHLKPVWALLPHREAVADPSAEADQAASGSPYCEHDSCKSCCFATDQV